MHKIQVDSITIKKFRIICFVTINGDKYSNAQIKTKLLELMPSLANHKCKNENNVSFFDVMDNTSLAHILEHMIIDLQISYSSSNSSLSSQAIMGTSEWIDENQGKAKIEFNYFNDIDALRAIKEAQEIINKI